MAGLRVAVIGAGIFGCTVAIDLAQAGASVDLYEAGYGILEGTTARCQARLHSGYHYPRSPETALAAKTGAIEFAARYPESIIKDVVQYYAIAPDSVTSPEDFIQFCKELDLPYEEEKPPQLRGVDLCVKVPELFIDVDCLRRLVRKELWRTGVSITTNHHVDTADLESFQSYDRVVWATYGQHWPDPLRFEVCELPVLEIGRYPRQSVVILDGPFGGVDSRGNLHTLYDVTHTVRWSWVGVGEPVIPDAFRNAVSRAPMPLKPKTGEESLALRQMIESLGRFFWALEPGGQGVSIYHGSLWSVRTVLPTVDATDERPTLIKDMGKDIYLLSGKICTAVNAGRQVTEMVMEA